MTDPIFAEPEEELNEERKARHEAEERDGSIVGAVERTIDTLVRPLVRDGSDPEDREEQREENDREQRPEG